MILCDACGIKMERERPRDDDYDPASDYDLCAKCYAKASCIIQREYERRLRLRDILGDNTKQRIKNQLKAMVNLN